MYQCVWEGCTKHFGSQSVLDNHVKRHLRDYAHFCDKCDKGFVTGRELRMHQVFHKPEKDFACSVCGKKYARRVNLNTHMTLHTGNALRKRLQAPIPMNTERMKTAANIINNDIFSFLFPVDRIDTTILGLGWIWIFGRIPDIR